MGRLIERQRHIWCSDKEYNDIIGSCISSLGSNNSGEEKVMITSAETAPEGENRGGEGEAIKIRSTFTNISI